MCKKKLSSTLHRNHVIDYYVNRVVLQARLVSKNWSSSKLSLRLLQVFAQVKSVIVSGLSPNASKKLQIKSSTYQTYNSEQEIFAESGNKLLRFDTLLFPKRALTMFPTRKHHLESFKITVIT